MSMLGGPGCLALSLSTLPLPRSCPLASLPPHYAALLGLPALMDGPTAQPPSHSFPDAGPLAF